MAWEFTPEQAWKPVEMADHLKEGCLAYTKDRQRLLVPVWWQAPKVPTRPVPNTLKGARRSLDLRTYKWMLWLNQRHNPNHKSHSSSQEETIEMAVDPSQWRKKLLWRGGWKKSSLSLLRRGSLFCSRTATRTGGSDRNHKRDRNHPVPTTERAARYAQRLQLPAR